MMEIVNKDCVLLMNAMGEGQVDLVLTSPPYNTSRTNLSDRAINNHEGRYDIHIDMMTQDEYISWCVDLFNNFLISMESKTRTLLYMTHLEGLEQQQLVQRNSGAVVFAQNYQKNNVNMQRRD